MTIMLAYFVAIAVASAGVVLALWLLWHEYKLHRQATRYMAPPERTIVFADTYENFGEYDDRNITTQEG